MASKTLDENPLQIVGQNVVKGTDKIHDADYPVPGKIPFDKNPLDIRDELRHVEKFADNMFKNFKNMIRTFIDYFKRFILAAFNQSKVVFAFFTIILVGIMLFSKDKISHTLMIGYGFISFLIIFFVLGILRLLLTFFEIIWKLIKTCFDFFSKPHDPTLKQVGKVLLFILRIIVMLVFYLLPILAVLIFFAWIIKKLINLNNILFKTINNYTEFAVDSADSFGSIVRRILDNC